MEEPVKISLAYFKSMVLEVMFIMVHYLNK